MTWKEKALHAFDERQAQRQAAEEQREHAEHAAQLQAFHRALETLLEEDVPPITALTTEIEGVTFGWIQNPHRYPGAPTHLLVVRGVCPTCGQPDWSAEVTDWASLGACLTSFRPGRGHECRAADGRSLIAAQRLQRKPE